MRQAPNLKQNILPAPLPGFGALIAAWLLEQAALQKDRLFLWLPVFLAFGIGFYFALPSEPPVVLGIFAVAVPFCLAFLLAPQREASRVNYAAWLGVCALLLMACGFLAAQCRTAMVDAPMIVKQTRPLDVEGTIAAIEDLGETEGSRILLSHLKIEKLFPKDTPHYVRLKLRKSENIAVGQRVKVLAVLNPPSPPSIPDGFDFQRYAYFKQIGAVGFIFNAPEILQNAPPHGFDAMTEGLRDTIARRVEAAVPYPQAGVIMALMVGKRAAIDEDNLEAIRDSGLAHMLAISGLHVGLFSAVFFFFSRFIMAAIPGFALRHPIKKYAAVIGMVAAFAYMLLAGSTIPAQRAMMMSGVVFLAIIFDRSAISLRLVALAAFAVLLLAPDSLMSASFQMSFAAVSALIVFYDVLRPYWSRWHTGASWPRRAALYFLGVCFTTVIASMATAPFALFHFQKLAAYSLLSNFIAVPLLAFVIMPMAVASLLLMPLGLERFPLSLMSTGVEGMLDIAHWTAALEGSVLHVSQWPAAGLLWIVAGALVIMLVRGKLKALAVLPLSLGVIAIAAAHTPDILVSASHDLVGYSAGRGQWAVSTRRREKFIRENWESLYGMEEGAAEGWPAEGQKASGLICGRLGCHVQRGGYKIAFSRSPLSLAEDCNWADILVADDPVDKRNCAAGTVIDKFDTWKYGAHGVWLAADGDKAVTVKRVQLLRGHRPWTVVDSGR